jgi:putative ABC transport system permease protein
MINKMDNLVVSNLLHRKTRTIVSAAGVSLGVVLLVMTVGLVHGMLNEQGRRNAAITAEIILGPPGSNFMDLSPTLSLPASLADQLKGIEGVREAVPVGRYHEGRLIDGRVIDGIDYESFARVSGLRIKQGRPISAGDEAIIDTVLQRTRRLKPGDEIQVLDRPFRIVGIYEPESMGRIKVPLATLQSFSGREGLCSMLLISVDDPTRQDEVAAIIKEKLPEYRLFFSRDLVPLYSAGIPAINTFLNVVVALSTIISSLVILLTMYTTVSERTRQIGILKSLGASRPWIASEIQKEALLLTVTGALMGLLVSVAAKVVLRRFVSVNIDLEPAWILFALGVGLASGAIGAMYPSLRAAGQDPVKALSYE